jgi:hypothetical protein
MLSCHGGNAQTGQARDFQRRRRRAEDLRSRAFLGTFRSILLKLLAWSLSLLTEILTIFGGSTSLQSRIVSTMGMFRKSCASLATSAVLLMALQTFPVHAESQSPYSPLPGDECNITLGATSSPCPSGNIQYAIVPSLQTPSPNGSPYLY